MISSSLVQLTLWRISRAQVLTSANCSGLLARFGAFFSYSLDGTGFRETPVRAQRAGLDNRRSVRRADALAAADRRGCGPGREHSGEQDPEVKPQGKGSQTCTAAG